MSVPTKEMRTKRYLELLEELRSEYAERHDGKDHGWITWAADKLGRSQGFISQVLGGKAVGENSAKVAAASTGRTLAWFYGDAAESHVEPMDEHQHIQRARESGHYPEWVLAAAKAWYHNRHGMESTSYGELVDWMDRVHAAGEADLKAKTSRIGPPKRNG